MNQKSADDIFEAVAYLTSLIDWDNDMSYAHGGTYNRLTNEASIQLNVLKDVLYKNEISDNCKAKYDDRNKGMYYHWNKTIEAN